MKGNLSIYTKEEAIYELFSKCGDIVDIKIGLNEKNKQPAGFCFVEYFDFFYPFFITKQNFKDTLLVKMHIMLLIVLILQCNIENKKFKVIT